VYTFSVSLALRTYRHLIAATMPDKQPVMRDWYAREVRPVYHKVSSSKLIADEDT